VDNDPLEKEEEDDDDRHDGLGQAKATENPKSPLGNHLTGDTDFKPEFNFVLCIAQNIFAV
jgi:hypothetical protein